MLLVTQKVVKALSQTLQGNSGEQDMSLAEERVQEGQGTSW